MSPRLVAITGFRLTTNQPYRLARFYAEGIGFAIVGRTPIPAEEMTLLGLAGGGIRLALRLGGQTLDLDCFDWPGEPYPAGTTAAHGIFQHLAVVASDAVAAHTRACAHLPRQEMEVRPQFRPALALQFPIVGIANYETRGGADLLDRAAAHTFQRILRPDPEQRELDAR
jgi:hypothetical protein